MKDPQHLEHSALTEARIEHIASLMRSLRYRTGRTSRELAKDWRLALRTVERYTAAASKRVRAELEDPDVVRVDVTATLRTIMHRARRARGDDRAACWRAAIDAGKTWASLTGNGASRGATDFAAGLSARELVAWMKETLPELEEKARAEEQAAGVHSGNA